MFLLQMWVDLCLRHRYSELRYHPGILFLWWVQCVHPYLSLINFGWKPRVVTPACFFDYFAWKTFSSPFLWGNIYVYYRGVFLVCSKIMDPVFCIQSVILYLLIGELSLLMLRDIKDISLLVLLCLLLEVELCVCDSPLLGLV